MHLPVVMVSLACDVPHFGTSFNLVRELGEGVGEDGAQDSVDHGHVLRGEGSGTTVGRTLWQEK